MKSVSIHCVGRSVLAPSQVASLAHALVDPDLLRIGDVAEPAARLEYCIGSTTPSGGYRELTMGSILEASELVEGSTADGTMRTMSVRLRFRNGVAVRAAISLLDTSSPGATHDDLAPHPTAVFEARARHALPEATGHGAEVLSDRIIGILADLATAIDAGFGGGVHDGGRNLLMRSLGLAGIRDDYIDASVYSWLTLLTPTSVEALGGSDRIRAESPAEKVMSVPLGTGTGLIACLGSDPSIIGTERWRSWADYLEPVMPSVRPDMIVGSNSYPDWIHERHRHPFIGLSYSRRTPPVTGN